jgi:hypothetical protein
LSAAGTLRAARGALGRARITDAEEAIGARAALAVRIAGLADTGSGRPDADQRGE